MRYANRRLPLPYLILSVTDQQTPGNERRSLLPLFTDNEGIKS